MLWDTTTIPDGDFYLIQVTANDGVFVSADISDMSFIIDNQVDIALFSDPLQMLATAILLGSIVTFHTKKQLSRHLRRKRK